VLTDTAPYGSTDGVIAILEKFRETGLGGNPITTDLVGKFGFGEEVARRIVLSLKLLDLVSEDGTPLPSLLDFKQASSEKYRTVLADQLRDSYSVVFAVTGEALATMSTTQVEDAFRSFRPDSLRKRMVQLFLGLCAYAGIIPEKPKPGPKGGRKKDPASVKVHTTHRAKKLAPALPPPPPAPPAPRGDSYEVTLKSGGSVTLAVDVRLFDLTTDDRKFVIDLIDALKGYGNRPALNAGGSS
jgi:hypothetical protein